MTMIEDRPMTMPDGKVDGTKYNANIPKPEGGKIPWFVPGKGWTLVTQAYADQVSAAANAAFAEAARRNQVTWEATHRPTKWPARHQPLLNTVREMARDGWRWNWNRLDTPALKIPAGGLVLIHEDGRDLEYLSLDAAAEALCGEAAPAPKRTSKAQLVKFLGTALDHLPADLKADAARLLAEA